MPLGLLHALLHAPFRLARKVTAGFCERHESARRAPDRVLPCYSTPVSTGTSSRFPHSAIAPSYARTESLPSNESTKNPTVVRTPAWQWATTSSVGEMPASESIASSSVADLKFPSWSRKLSESMFTAPGMWPGCLFPTGLSAPDQ